MSIAEGSEHVAGSRVLENSDWSYETSRFGPGLEFSMAQITALRGQEWSSASTPGVTICGVVRGGLEFNLDRRGFEISAAPMMFVLNSDEPISTQHRLQETQRLTAITVHISDEFIEQLREANGSATDKLPRILSARRNGPQLCAWFPNRTLTTVLRRMAACPYRGMTRQLYLQGKALELVGFVADETGAPPEQEAKKCTSPANIERVTAARDILISEFNAPPSLDQLARRVGMSTSLLTASFRARFNMSITAFCQEYRLERAYRDLESGQLTVAQAAFEAGYSPAYFSTLFRRRYGFSPSEIGSRRR